MIERLNAALEGRYVVERMLGEGGMATVYLAQDLKHGRQVAIKVLRPELAAVVGAERFLSEIRTTASLQHPHILPLFDSGEADGFLFYVMPYVEGESLRERLDREHQLPIDEAVELTRRIASALQHAHDRGIVHRDIKPANILLSQGEPLVADFGIALAVSSAGGGRITETGLSLGTPHYMSPEQASGDRSLDPRSDVYALGCVLYEALVGEPPFPGPTPQAVLARILTGRPPRVAAGRPTVPAHVDAAVARSLEKLPADRFGSVADFRKALVDPSFRHVATRPAEAAAAPGAAAPSAGRGRHPVATRAVGLTALAAVLLAGLWGWVRPGPAAPFRAFQVVLEGSGPEFGPLIALSPSGDAMAYVTESSGLAIRPMAATESRAVPIGEPARTPFFSPDGSALGFHSGASPESSALQWVRTQGGGKIEIARSVYPGGAWSEDGYIYYVSDDDLSLWRARPQGGTPERLPKPEGSQLRWPHAVEGGDRLLIQLTPGEGEERRLALYDPGDGEVQVIEGAGLEGAFDGRYAGGFLFWVDRQFNLLAARFDLEDARLAGPAVTLATEILIGGNGGGANLDVADDGTLLYATGIASSVGLGENLAWVRPDGTATIIEERLADQLSDFDGLALGPTERYVAVQVDPPDELADSRREIWIFDTRQSTVYPLTFDGQSFDPEWLDARRVAYLRPNEAGGTAIHAQPWDRSGEEALVLELDRSIVDFEPGPDGAPLILELAPAEDGAEDAGGLYLADPGDPASLRRFVDTGFDEGEPAISPDGRWVAYVSDETGRNEVYVRAFPGGGRPWPISTEGGARPRWGPGSDRIYFRSRRALVAADLDFTGGVDVAGFTRLFDTTPFELSGYQASGDGERLLMIRESEGGQAGTTVLMLNVFGEIERRLAR